MKSNSVCFSVENYAQLKETYRLWWDNKLDRPIVPIMTCGYDSNRTPSPYSPLSWESAWDFSVNPDQLVDAHDWNLSRMRWHGDAFPSFNTMWFGPGVLSAFLGCTPVVGKDTIWFQPPRKDIPIEELHFEMNKNNPYLRRVMNLYEAGMEKWRGNVVMNMVDMGGILDTLATFRGSENLLMDLYDAPDEVLRCVNELQDMWFKHFDLFCDIMGPEASGYSHWFGIYCEKPSYIIQSDFSYMISPAMFSEFVAPELASSAARMHNTLYHMDGVGELPHLDMLLSTDSIKGIQWTPGAGEPAERDWTELYEKILASGKKLVSCARKPDGRPIDAAKNPGQLFFGDEYFDAGKDMYAAQAYGALYGIEIK